MAIARKIPKCPICGAEINAICKYENDLPHSMRTVGDTFIKWDWEGHKCDLTLSEICDKLIG